MKVYAVSYNAGLGGTWLTWFINQHEGFQKYDVQFKPNKLEYTSYDDLMWYYNDHDWQTTVVKNCWNDKSNVVYKLFPKHNYYDIDRAEDLLRSSNTIGIIVPYVNEELKQEFVKRNTHCFDTSVERSVLNIDWSRVNCTSSDENRNAYSRFNQHWQILTIDMGRLLNCNRNEYHKLTKFLHVSEHPDYESLCAEYKQNCFPS